MLKTIYFDIGNVLLFFSHAKMFEQISTCTGIELLEVKKLLLEHRLQEQYETGTLDSESIFHIFQNHSTKPFSLHEFLNAISNIFTPNHNLWTLVEELKQKGKRLILLSNTNECHFNHAYSYYPILHLFDHKILSFEVGAMKPDPRIFKKALLYAQCSPEECFYTDDLSENILSAKEVGLNGEVFTDVPTLRQHLAARELS